MLNRESIPLDADCRFSSFVLNHLRTLYIFDCFISLKLRRAFQNAIAIHTRTLSCCIHKRFITCLEPKNSIMLELFKSTNFWKILRNSLIGCLMNVIMMD